MAIEFGVVGMYKREYVHEYQRMAEIFSLCAEMNISIPEEVYEFFEGKNPEPLFGEEISITDAVTRIDPEDNRGGLTVKLNKLPPHCDRLVFWYEEC